MAKKLYIVMIGLVVCSGSQFFAMDQKEIKAAGFLKCSQEVKKELPLIVSLKKSLEMRKKNEDSNGVNTHMGFDSQTNFNLGTNVWLVYDVDFPGRPARIGY